MEYTYEDITYRYGFDIKFSQRNKVGRVLAKMGEEFATEEEADAYDEKVAEVFNRHINIVDYDSLDDVPIPVANKLSNDFLKHFGANIGTPNEEPTP